MPSPGAHVAQMDAPAVPVYLPCTQLAHALAADELAYCPAAHCAHAVNPVLLAYVPGWQLLHELDWLLACAWPVGHNVQMAWPLPAYRPATHALHWDCWAAFCANPGWQSLHVSWPAAAYLPKVQAVHVDAGAGPEANPDWHVSQALDPTVEENWPDGQLLHTPLSAYLPFAQLVHAVADAADAWPGAQSRQSLAEAAPYVVLYLPAAQSKQLDLAEPGWYLPVGQFGQLLSLASE